MSTPIKSKPRSPGDRWWAGERISSFKAPSPEDLWWKGERLSVVPSPKGYGNDKPFIFNSNTHAGVRDMYPK